MSTWNGNNFSIYKSEEKQVLKLIKELGDQVNHNTDNKTDKLGDHAGSWQGINKPTLSNEGLAGTVEKHENDIAETTKYPIKEGEIGVVNKSLRYGNILRYFNGVGDCTQAIKNSLANGNKNIYFPEGTYFFNNEIILNHIEFYGAGVRKTYFKPFLNDDVIKVNSQNNSVQWFKIHDISIVNQENFNLANGLVFTAKGTPLTINDQHDIYNFEISGFNYNLLINDRLIYTTFRRGQLHHALKDNMRIETTDSVNDLNFIDVQFSDAQDFGVFMKHGTVALLQIGFSQCVIERNFKNTVGLIKCGMYIENFFNVDLKNCYIEDNAVGQVDGKNVVVRGTYAEGFNIDNSLMWGSDYALDIDVTLIYGSLTNSKTAGKIKLYSAGTDSVFNIDNTRTDEIEDVPNVANFHTILSMKSSPVVYNTKWIPSGGDDGNNATVLFNSATRDLVTLGGKYKGQLCILMQVGGDLTVKQTGNISLKDELDYTINTSKTTLTLIYDGTKWKEIART